jgi:hypothetical protein
MLSPWRLAERGVCALALGVCLAIVPAAAGETVAVDVLANDANGTVIHYQIEGFDQAGVTIDGVRYTQLKLEGEAVTKEVGAPEVPLVARSIVIPGDAAMQVNIIDSEFREIHDVDVVPSKGFISRTIDPDDVPWTFGKPYEIDAFSPGALATLGEPYIMRDQRGLVVQVFPFQYNPVQRVLRVYTDITLEVVNVGKSDINVLAARPRALPGAFNDLYEAHFINYVPPERYDPLDEFGDMLIICYDPWISLVEPLAAHKAGIGINTAIVGVSTIPGGNNAASIKAYIQQVFDTSDLAFVLLVGDGLQVDTGYASGGASDPDYSLLAGSDSYPDIMVGRFSAESEADVMTQVERTITYETMPATLQEWFWRGMGVASAQGSGIGDDGEADYEHVGSIWTQLMGCGYTEFDGIYDPSATAAMVTAGLNAGRGAVFYCGHGSTTSWSTTGFSNSNVDALVNDNMLPFISSVACVNGNFDGPTCFGEAWLRATHNGVPTGAIGFYGSSINQSWAPPMEEQDELANLLCAGTYSCLGTLLYAGSCSMMDAYGSGGVDMFMTWHLFGDPSVCVVGTPEPPTGMRVQPFTNLVSEGPNGGPFLPESITYTLTNYDETPIEYEVTTDCPWVDMTGAGGLIPAGGEADVTVSIGPSANGFANGHYEGVVSFTNVTNGDGDCARNVVLDVGVPTPVHVMNLDTMPLCSMFGQWQYGQPLGQGGASYGNPDPTSGYTGTNVLGVNLAGDYSTEIGGPYDMTIRGVDCSELYQCELHFMRWLNTDYEPYAYATVAISNDGFNFEEIWTNGSSAIYDGDWSEQVFDISEYADGEQYVYLRWGYEIGSSGVWACSGWNVDDIEVWGVPLQEPEPCPGDIDDDGEVGVTDFLELLAAWGPNPGHPADIDGSGTVDVGDFLELLGVWGPCP